MMHICHSSCNLGSYGTGSGTRTTCRCCGRTCFAGDVRLSQPHTLHVASFAVVCADEHLSEFADLQMLHRQGARTGIPHCVSCRKGSGSVKQLSLSEQSLVRLLLTACLRSVSYHAWLLSYMIVLRHNMMSVLHRVDLCIMVVLRDNKELHACILDSQTSLRQHISHSL